jgi:sugar lactone lactonase YvrE
MGAAVVLAALPLCATAHAHAAPPHAAKTKHKHKPKGARHPGNAAPTVFPSLHYKVETVIRPSRMHGVRGIAVGPDGALYAAGQVDHTIYRIDPATKAMTAFLGPPRGGAGDLAFGPHGTLAWTAPGEAALMIRKGGGAITTVSLPMRNVQALNFAKDGRLFFSTVGENDGLYEANLTANGAPRLVAPNLGGLGAFQIMADGVLYGPLAAPGKIVKVTLTSGKVEDVAAGFLRPVAVRLDSNGALIVLDAEHGEVVRVGADGEKKTLATLAVPADGLAIAKNGTIYVTSAAANGIAAINPKTGDVRWLTRGALSAPGNLTVVPTEQGEALLVADLWGVRRVDPQSGTAETLKGMLGVFAATSVAVHGDDYIFGTVSAAGIIQIVARDSGEVQATLPYFGAPYEIAPVSDGFVVADYAVGRLTKVADDAAHTRSTLAWGFDGPVGLVSAGRGMFYVSEYDTGTITRVDAASNERVPVLRGLSRPEGLAWAPNGKLLVAETGARRVLAVDPKSGSAEVLADDLAIGLKATQSAPGLPTGIAVGKDGAIYVTGDVDNVLYRLTPP